jgi:hypothetical protein
MPTLNCITGQIENLQPTTASLDNTAEVMHEKAASFETNLLTINQPKPAMLVEQHTQKKY